MSVVRRVAWAWAGWAARVGMVLLATCGGDLGGPVPTGDEPPGDSAGGDTISGDPAMGDPAMGDPTMGDPAMGDPAMGDPAMGDPIMGDPGIDPLADEDSDGLPNGFEIAAGMPSILNWQVADTDDNGTDDGDEDPDDDGATNLEEYALSIWGLSPAGTEPHPLRTDIFVELDSMTSRSPSDQLLALAASAYEALPHTNVDGSMGVGLHFLRDEEFIAAFDFTGDLDERKTFFETHGPSFGAGSPPIPLDRLVHVAFVTLRSDLPDRGGEIVWDTGNDLNKVGVFIFYDALDVIFPTCGFPMSVPPLPDVSLEEALANSLAHEIGHALQLGHDTATGGGINYYNAMAIFSGGATCGDAQMFFHGWMNSDPSLGNTEAASAPRFSDAAYNLMAFDDIVGVDNPIYSGTEM